MSIDRWNKDASAHARIDALEKQIADMRGYEISHTVKVDAQSNGQGLKEAMDKTINEWWDRNNRHGGVAAR